MTSNWQSKDHPRHEEHAEWRRQYERSDERKRLRNARMTKWRKANPEKWRAIFLRAYAKSKDKIKAREQAYRLRYRQEMVDAYGGKCVCCGETEIGFLSIDHIHNDGASDPVAKGKRVGKYNRSGGFQFYRRLKKLGWPKDKYQLMCYNCNLGRGFNGGVCPHQRQRELKAVS